MSESLSIADIARMTAEAIALQRWGPDAQFQRFSLDSVEVEESGTFVVCTAQIGVPLRNVNVSFGIADE